MGKALVKLYRDLPRAKRALEQLLKSGFKLEEISLLLDAEDSKKIPQLKGSPRVEVPLAGGSLAVVGPAAGMLGNDSWEQGVREALGIPSDGFGYYQFGLAAGGVVVGVYAEGERLAQARRILRGAGELSAEKAKSPGFEQAKRMTESDPVDAKMTGDFRRY